MWMRTLVGRSGWIPAVVLMTGAALRAQEPTPPTPPPALPPAVDAEPSREVQLEERIRRLEATIDALNSRIENLATPPAASAATGTDAADAGAQPPGSNVTGGDTGNAATTTEPSASGGASAPGQSLPPNPAPSRRFDMPATLDNKPGKVKFGPGFEIRTDDDEYVFQFHNLTQFEFRGYTQAGQANVHNTFDFPRQWFMFSGRVTKPVGYFVSMAHGFDALSILDVFVDFDIDPKARFRAGRFKTPFTYEFFVEPVQGLVVPERSIFFNNFAQNRDLGIMGFGRLMNGKLDYAYGFFNGTRNGVIDLDNAKAVAGFFNYRPFGNATDSLLENLNIGGSVFAGNQDHVALPQTLRTIVPTAGSSIIGVPFLSFNNNVREEGFDAFWDLHAAYYYKQLAVIGEWASGRNEYALSENLQNRTRVPINSYYVQASYLLTGETRSSIGILKPRNPVTFKPGNSGLGAWEPYARYEYLDISQNVFSAGFSDPNLWTNRVQQTWVGMNWHLTQYVKMYFGWNHAMFGDPVIFSPGRRQLTSDMFLWRLQLYF